MKVLVVDYQAPNAPELFTQSLRETGFAVLKNHPISEERVTGLYQEWHDFFYSEEKHNYLLNPALQDGYVPPSLSETAKGYKEKDLKEFYHIYPFGRYPTSLSPATQHFYSEMLTVGSILLSWIQEQTPEEIRRHFSMPLNEMICDQQTLLRILHYPPLQGDEPAGAIRAAAHEDINLITLLPAATTSGLQVKDTSGQWHDVPCDYGSLVINVGDMLQMCSQHYYPSTTHQVVNPAGEAAKTSRFSMPLFVHPRSDVRLSEGYTAQQYLDERLRELGLKN